MNFPIEPEILGIKLPIHALFEALAFVIGYRYYVYLKKKKNDEISDDSRLIIVIGAAAGALIGSRVLGALEQPVRWMESEYFWLYLYSNKTIVGGLVGGLIGVELTKKIIGVSKSSGDLFTFPLILAIIIGRIGCFAMGVSEETYGVSTSLPWGIDLGDGVMRHPVVIYEIIYLILIWIFLRFISVRYDLRSGLIFKFFMISYMVYRFGQDFIKPVFYYPNVQLSAIQIVCLILLIYYAKTIYQIIAAPSKLILRST